MRKSQKGITIIALIITVIVLLIIAGITIGSLTANNGIIRKATKAKLDAETLEEKEEIDNAIIKTIGNNKKGDLILEELQNNLEDGTRIIPDEDTLLIIPESGKVFTVDKEGEIINVENEFKTPEKILNTELEDSSYGSNEQKPYEINCIEDLLDFSFAVNGIKISSGSIRYVSQYKNFSNKYVRLNRNLNFKSVLSYENSERTDYGDLNQDGETKTIKEELTEGTGWISIGEYGETTNLDGFKGTFYCADNNKKISNLYINQNGESALEATGLFGKISNGKIRGLQVEGNIYCKAIDAGGIVGKTRTGTYVEILNCSFSGKIENTYANGNTGGIIGIISNTDTFKIEECKNYANVIGKADVDASNFGTGGIIGDCTSTGGSIINCINYGAVKGASKVGGIQGAGKTILNGCHNDGAVTGKGNVGGIVGFGGKSIQRCYNNAQIKSTATKTGGIIGTVTSGSFKISQCFNTTKGVISGTSNVGGIVGQIYSASNATIEQCYNLADITGTTTTSGITGGISGNDAKILNCYNKGKITGTKVAGIAEFSATTYQSSAKTVSCYNTGTLDATNKSGVVGAGKRKNIYYLSTCGATDTVAVSKSESELKGLSTVLDTAFEIDDGEETITLLETMQEVWENDTENINEGYPILKWQND